MQAASNSSLFAIVIGAPRTMDTAPIVITDMYQVATIRARRTLLDMPLNAGVAGAVLLPFWMAVGAILALAKEFSIGIERNGDNPV